jgi:dsDNA-binding SOS-regulon protein
LASYGQFFALSDGTVTPDHLVVAEGDDEVVAKQRSPAARGDKELDVTTTLDFTLENANITRIDESTSALASMDVFWP